MLTWDQFYAGEFPPENERDWTLKTLFLLRAGMQDNDLLTSYLKWGLPIVQDLCVLVHFNAAKRQEHLDNDAAMQAASGVLQLVDWDEVETIVRDGAEDYKRYLSAAGELDRLQPYLDEMEYRLQGLVPGCSVPGDLFRSMTGKAYG